MKQFGSKSIVGSGGKPCPPGIVGVGINSLAKYYANDLASNT